MGHGRRAHPDSSRLTPTNSSGCEKPCLLCLTQKACMFFGIISQKVSLYRFMIPSSPWNTVTVTILFRSPPTYTKVSSNRSNRDNIEIDVKALRALPLKVPIRIHSELPRITE